MNNHGSGLGSKLQPIHHTVSLLASELLHVNEAFVENNKEKLAGT